VDGPAIAESLRKLAAELDKQADDIDALVDIFELAEIGTTQKFIPEGTKAETTWIIGRAANYPFVTFDPFGITGSFEQDGGILWEQD
jgi:hypothetical protein